MPCCSKLCHCRVPVTLILLIIYFCYLLLGATVFWALESEAEQDLTYNFQHDKWELLKNHTCMDNRTLEMFITVSTRWAGAPGSHYTGLSACPCYLFSLIIVFSHYWSSLNLGLPSTLVFSQPQSSLIPGLPSSLVFPHPWSSLILGLPSSLVFPHPWSSLILGLPSSLVFPHPWSSLIPGLPSSLVFPHPWSSLILGLPSSLVFPHPWSSLILGLPSSLVFPHPWSSLILGLPSSSVFPHPRYSLILGLPSSSVFPHPWSSLILGLPSSLVFPHPWSSLIHGLPSSSVFPHPRYSLILGIHSSSLFTHPRYSLILGLPSSSFSLIIGLPSFPAFTHARSSLVLGFHSSGFSHQQSHQTSPVMVSSAAGQGVTITGNATFNNWNWPNAVIFAATVITTIGYGNVAPKTSAGRLFCIFYGLFGVPLCLTWISALGKFFAGRAKRLGQFLTKRGVTLRKAQITCTAIFIFWGVLVHLVIPPFIFMRTEGWDYIEGLYFSFITITTIGFGDYVAGVNPKKSYGVLYRYFVEIWIYLGLAWLSLFVNWKVSMFVEVHKAIKKRRKKRKGSFENDPRTKKDKQIPLDNSKDVNILSFLSKKEETYNDLIKQIGKNGLKTGSDRILNGELPSNGPNKGKDMMVMYTKRNGFDYDAVTFSNGLQKDNGMRPLQDREATIFINQLDRISEEEGEPWESKDYKPLIFQNNINDEEDDEEEEEEEEEEEGDNSEDEEKSKSSIEENESPGTPTRLDTFTCLDESSFSSSDTEVSVPYEQLLNGYNKINNQGET
ncbi:potassium channel subfamily K member 5 [Rhinoderma darwinii]|uniref:potassium channel subfamily K member 5 n=1 Tax=Rhinoderma darwinii TaxID=43563 RepID=UPI003F661DDE